MSSEVIAALAGAVIGALISVLLGNYLSNRSERQRIRFQILTILVGQRGKIMSENVKDHINVIPVVFGKNHDVRRAYQHLYTTAELGKPEFYRRYNELFIAIAKNLGFTHISQSDLEFGFFPYLKSEAKQPAQPDPTI